MTYDEKCKAMADSYRDHNIDTLKEARNKALVGYEKANAAYLAARDSYHKVYRDIWR